VSTAPLEKDFLLSEVFSAFTAPVVYREHEAKFVLCGGTAVSKAHRFTERISEDVDLRVIVPTGLSRSAQKRLLSHVKAEVLDRLRQQGYDIPDEIVKQATRIATSRSCCRTSPSIRPIRRYARNC
jgi:predicted nucleotidyltransferase component of viral defense system